MGLSIGLDRAPIEIFSIDRVNYGCGGTILKSWLNVDLFGPEIFRTLKPGAVMHFSFPGLEDVLNRHYTPPTNLRIREGEEPLKQTTIVYTDHHGQLANQLFSHAHLLAFCLEHAPRFSLFNQSITRYRDFLRPSAERFGNPAPLFVLASRVALARWSVRQIAKYALPNTRELNLDTLRDRRWVVLHGWNGGDDTLLAKHRKQITDQVTLRHNKVLVLQFERTARARGSLMIGVHIRHGDFRSFMGGRLFVPVADYVSAMNEVATTLGRDVSFLICSDEKRTIEEFEGLPVTITAGTSPSDDLTLLSKCDGIIGSHSTFSAWASFVGHTPLIPLERGMPATSIRAAAAKITMSPYLIRAKD